MNNFIHAINGFKEPKVYYSDTDSLFIEEDSLNKLKELKFYGKDFGQGKNDLAKKIPLTCEQWKLLGKKCNNNPDVAHTHIYETDPVITKAFFLGPKQKWIETYDKKIKQAFTSLTLKGIPSKINEKHLIKQEDGSESVEFVNVSIENKFTLEQFVSLIEAQRSGNDKKKYKIDFANRLQ